MFRAGRRLFSAASIGLVLVGVLHAIGHYFAGPSSEGERQMFAAMAAFRSSVGLGMMPSELDVLEGLSATMAIALVWLGILNLIVAQLDDTRGEIVRRFTAVSLAGIGGLMILYGLNRLTPPFAMLAPVETLFAISILTASRTRWR